MHIISEKPYVLFNDYHQVIVSVYCRVLLDSALNKILHVLIDDYKTKMIFRSYINEISKPIDVHLNTYVCIKRMHTSHTHKHTCTYTFITYLCVHVYVYP